MELCEELLFDEEDLTDDQQQELAVHLPVAGSQDDLSARDDDPELDTSAEGSEKSARWVYLGRASSPTVSSQPQPVMHQTTMKMLQSGLVPQATSLSIIATSTSREIPGCQRW